MLRVLLVLALLCIVALPAHIAPAVLEDDYPHITLAQHYGDPATGATGDASLPLPRHCGVVLLRGLEHLWAASGGLLRVRHPLAHPEYLAGVRGGCVAGHRVPDFRVGGGLFAIYEGHQEAVMWLSACNELWQFLFVMAAFVCCCISCLANDTGDGCMRAGWFASRWR